MFAYEVVIPQLNEQVSMLRENVEGRTSSKICELKRKIQVVGERVGSIASHMDQEENSDTCSLSGCMQHTRGLTPMWVKYERTELLYVCHSSM